MLSKALFLNLGSMTFGAGEILCLGAVLPGLYLLDASSNPFSSCDIQTSLQTLANIPRGGDGRITLIISLGEIMGVGKII